MKLHSTLLAATAALAFATAPVSAHDVTFMTGLSGAAEAPPNASPGTGSASVTINDHDFTMRVQASFNSLLGTVTAAHIHCCTAVAGVGTAGVATRTPTFAGFPSGVTSGNYDMTFDMTQASSWNTAFINANGGSTGSAFSALLNGLQAGGAYFNVHTTAAPAGEIRGFLAVTAVPEPSTYALLLCGLGAIGFAARRRRG